MRINYNVQAMRANNSLTKADNRVADSLRRLSSGLKVSSAKEDPSGYAISKRMNMQIEGLSTAVQSANDAISVIETADGALSEIHDMIQRINELAVKASTETMTDDDRKTIQEEIVQLKDEISRISKTTEFNGQVLLDGTFDVKGYTDTAQVKVSTYSDSVQYQKYNISDLEVVFDEKGNITGATGTLGAEFPTGAQITDFSNNRLTITGPDDFSITLSINPTEGAGTKTISALSVDCTGIGAMDMQIGANEGQFLAIRIPAINLENLGIEKIDLSTAEGAKSAIDSVKEALTYVSSSRSRLGAYQNRLEHVVNSLNVTSENMTKAYSGIVDVDMAEEMTAYTTEQVITQATTSLLAQANDRPSQALTLLQ